MTRLAQDSLALAFFGVSVFIVSCSGSSNNKDATPGAKDGSPVATDVANLPKLDTSADLAPITPADGPVPTPDAAVDIAPVAVDSARTGDATGAVGDAAVDSPAATVDVGPVATVDAPADAPADGGAVVDGGAPADDGGEATDSLPVACSFVGGSVVADLTLTRACSPYTITESIDIDSNAVLTIEAGVTLGFASDVGINVGYATAGKLVAVGTAQNPIVFTSAASKPQAGDWANIAFRDNTVADTKIAYAKLDYCGSGRNACIVGDGVGANRVTLDHLTIDHVGVRSNGILENDTDSNFIITNSTFSNIPTTPFPQYAISVQAASFAGIGAGNTFNGGATIELAGGTVASTTSWVDPGTAIAVTDALAVDGPNNPVLTLGPGMTLKFAADITFSIGPDTPEAKLAIAGTAVKRVLLTSLLASPLPGVWAGVDVWDGSKAQLSYTDISYGGGAGQGGGNLTLENGNSTSQVVVDHSSFSYSLGYGIYLPCADATTPPVATVTMDPSNTYANNAADTANVKDQAHNVGPGLACPH
jgi:hypothetical protein